MISIIVACAHSNVIGKDGDQPFYISADLKRFKELTTGHSVIMGRKTFQAILNRLGKPLPNRRNIVISSTLEEADGIEVAASLDDALALADPNDETFIIGGARVYSDAFTKADRIYLTKVEADFDGDVFFPEISDSNWKVTSTESHPAEGETPAYTFETLERIS